MSLTQDRHQIQLEVKNEAQVTFSNMEKEINQLEKSLKGMKKGTEEYLQTSQKIDQAKDRFSKYRKEVDLNQLSYQQR
ncbi:MAG: hypothetical protein HC831_26415 [Chloroflexia bacterium]|nr:hypothetical protein [Chloroflexia bacterium]